MRLVALLALTLATGSTALAEPSALTLGVSAGAVGTTDLDGAPAFQLDGGFAFAERTSLTAAVGGWTLGAAGTARSELLVSLGLQQSLALGGPVSLLLGAGPAMAVRDEFGKDASFLPGLALSPALELATRRRTLALRAGVTAALFQEGSRAAVLLGAAYRFE